MDNNFNQNQNQFQQQPQQADPFANNMYGQQFQQPKAPLKFNIMELLTMIFAGAGMLLVFIGTIFTCTCSAKKSFGAGSSGFAMSPVVIVTILGVLLAIAAVVCGIVSIKDKKDIKNANKIVLVSIVVAAFAIIYGILPTVTICGYNCSLQNQAESTISNMYNGLSNLGF